MSQVTVLFDQIFLPVFGFLGCELLESGGSSAEAHNKHSLNVKLLKWGMGVNVSEVTIATCHRFWWDAEHLVAQFGSTTSLIITTW